jgi:Na+-driven multidrug efflux pump
MNTTINLGTDNVKKIFWTYAIPSILAMIAQTTATLIDSIFIGQFVGAEGLSAITLFFPLLGILIGIGSMFAIGGTTLAGIELGKGNKEKSNNYFNVTLLFLSVLSIVSTFIVVMNMDTLTSILKIDDQSRLYVIQYGQTISYFFLFFMLNFALSFFLKLDGKPILVVIVMVSGTLINIILDYLLIVHFNMGLTGAALATGASQLIPWLILIINTLFRSNWRIEMPKIRWHEIKAIVFNGSSELLSNSAISIASIVINMMIINRVGVIGLAGYAVAIQVHSKLILQQVASCLLSHFSLVIY